MRPWILPFVAGAAAVALLATSIGLVVQTRRAADAQERAVQLAAENEELRERVRQLEAGEGRRDGLGGLLDGLLGGDTDGLLDGLLGDGPGGLLDGLLGGLLGGSGLDGLEGLLGGAGASGMACLAPDVEQMGTAAPLPDDPDALVEALIPQVAEQRELDWTDPVEVDFLTGAELSARLDDLLADSEDPARDAAYERLLIALGAVPVSADLSSVRRQLLDDQVAGYYAPETGELVVRVPDDGQVGTLDTITLAHELQHALADQALGLPDLQDLADEGFDRLLAAQAVVEGDATLFMQRWALASLPMEDQLAAATDGQAQQAQEQLDRVPDYLKRELLFPYTEGMDWVCDRWREGGWAAVDAAYADPPTTTAAVLHGDAANDPQPLDVAATPDGYEVLLDDEFGAAPLWWLFEAPGGDETVALPDARGRTAAWAGGRVQVFADGADTAVALALGDATGSLCDDVATWYARTWPEARTTTGDDVRRFDSSRQQAAVSCPDGEVRLGIAPDADLARTLTTR